MIFDNKEELICIDSYVFHRSFPEGTPCLDDATDIGKCRLKVEVYQGQILDHSPAESRLLIRSYSARNASMGSSFAALLAG